jgi:hypothetical protein
MEAKLFSSGKMFPDQLRLNFLFPEAGLPGQRGCSLPHKWTISLRKQAFRVNGGAAFLKSDGYRTIKFALFCFSHAGKTKIYYFCSPLPGCFYSIPKLCPDGGIGRRASFRD